MMVLFSLCHCIIGYWVLTLGVKWPGHEADYSLPSSAKVKNEWSYTSIPFNGVVLN
jgi:hypothetical protein